MIAVAQRDDFGGSGEAARSEDRGFVGFGSAVGEERFGELAVRRDCGQLLASAACGSCANTVETCCSVSICA